MAEDWIDAALRELWSGPPLPFSWWRKPNARMWRTSLAAGLPRTRQQEESAWVEAGRAAWVDGVRIKLESALAATAAARSWAWDEPIVPIDLTARPTHTVKLLGSSDPESLDYGGFLNLLGFGRDGVSGRECSSHPGRFIGEHGCPRCREIHEHRKARHAAGPEDGYPPLPAEADFAALQRYAGIRFIAEVFRLDAESFDGPGAADPPMVRWEKAERAYDLARAEAKADG